MTRLDPAIAATRLAVRRALADLTRARRANTSDRSGSGSGSGPGPGSGMRSAPSSASSALPAPLVLVGLSGGADSLALAAALAFEAPRLGIRAGAVIVDHGLQDGSAMVAARAAGLAGELGLDPVFMERVEVGFGASRHDATLHDASRHDATLHDASRTAGTSQGPEAAAREARYAAFAEVARRTGAAAILTAHTRDDQAEQVLLALARGSGPRSIAGIPPSRPLVRGEGGEAGVRGADGDACAAILRPFLAGSPEITRGTTEAACAAQGLEAWQDPHNRDPAYTRVRVRERVLPVLERELGPGVGAALARSADLAREDADALDEIADGVAERLMGDARGEASAVEADSDRAVRIPVAELAELPDAVRNRVIRSIAAAGFGAHLSREHTLAIARLVTAWKGQGPVFVPGIRVTRSAGEVILAAQHGSPRAPRRLQ